jgi:hypothetical protein
VPDPITLPPTVARDSAAGALPVAYLAFFDCFNRGAYFEAHEVLEALWLTERGRPNARFFQGLIQLAGAFVHFEKGRREPAVALLKLGRKHLAGYPATHLGLNLNRLRDRIGEWLALAAGGRHSPLADSTVLLEWPVLPADVAGTAPPSAVRSGGG